MILALPYHVKTGPERAGDPICTSVPSVKAFLRDIAHLARLHLECDFVIRSKTSAWTTESGLEDIRQELRALSNVILDADYTALNRSYELAARSTLIIAKPTSLVDEALACGIPCLLHDYTHNQAVYGEPLLTYLPHELWVSSQDELISRTDWILSEPSSFHRFWEPHRLRIYGGLADGGVRQRLHLELEKLISALPDSGDDTRL